jgi:hypothetical protein
VVLIVTYSDSGFSHVHASASQNDLFWGSWGQASKEGGALRLSKQSPFVSTPLAWTSVSSRAAATCYGALGSD